MTRKAFTLVELLVVIAVIALLMGILMPALSSARRLAYRLTCGANQYGIGKAMLLYSNDYEDELPRAGGRITTWGAVTNWAAPSRTQAYNLTADGSGGTATISSCFYLLVKYAEVTPKSFICRGDAGTTEFKLTDLATGLAPTFELIDGWDFGPSTESYKHCSYSYHMPFGWYALRSSDEPGLAVTADRNPWLASPAADPAVFAGFKPHLAPWNASSEKVRVGNAIAHRSDGQNVLFLDGHVRFEKRAYCAVEDDNVYTISDRPATGSPLGVVPMIPFSPANRKDSVLVHDPGHSMTEQGGT